jgi:hypothetical protein
MRPARMFRFASAFQLSVGALLVCGSQIYAQRLVDPRVDPRIAARAAARAALAAQAPRAATANPLPKAAGTFITFDAPGGCETPASFPACTDPVAINPAGEILGYSVDANGMAHGFLRHSSGTFTSFDVPGADVLQLCSRAKVGVDDRKFSLSQ